jgi:hypothetical protein
VSLSEAQAPFTEPYAVAGNPRGYRSKGPTAEACKRALAHLGFLPWKEDGDWDQHWNEDLNTAAGKWKAKRGLSDASDGSWGRKAHDVMQTAWYEKDGDHLPAFDGYAQKLLQDEAAKAAGGGKSPEQRVRDAIVNFCETGLAHPDGWTYSQSRAVRVDVDPAGNVTSDCSGSVLQAYAAARRACPDLVIPDPAKQGWSGYGNTDYYEDDHPTVTSGQYQVGDLAHYDGHVCLCIKAGDSSSADWWSFGSEPPSRRKLYYRSDFRKVVRPPLVT